MKTNLQDESIKLN